MVIRTSFRLMYNSERKNQGKYSEDNIELVFSFIHFVPIKVLHICRNIKSVRTLNHQIFNANFRKKTLYISAKL
jgi:hypothetical protein